MENLYLHQYKFHSILYIKKTLLSHDIFQSTKSEPCKYEAAKAENKIAKKPASEKAAAAIYDRLSSVHTKASSGGECRAKTAVATPHHRQVGEENVKMIFGKDFRYQIFIQSFSLSLSIA